MANQAHYGDYVVGLVKDNGTYVTFAAVADDAAATVLNIDASAGLVLRFSGSYKAA